MKGLRAANIEDRILIFGNFTQTRYHRNIIIVGGGGIGTDIYDDILEYNPNEDAIQFVGNMIQARSYHAVSVVQAQDYSKWCQ